MRRIRRTRRFAKAAYAVAALLLMLAAPAAGAADAPRVTLSVSPGTISSGTKKAELKFDEARSALVHNQLTGPYAHEYTFDAKKGEALALTLSSDWSQLVAIYLLPPGVETPIYTNFIDGTTRWQGVAPGNGTYTVRLVFLRLESKRNGLVDYDLQVRVTEGQQRLASGRKVRVADGSAAGR